MVGSVNGLVGLCRADDRFPDIWTFHNIIHREQLVSKKLNLDHIMKPVLEIVNYIRTHALNHRQFKNLIDELNQGLPRDQPLHCTVRWLSKANRFSILDGAADIEMAYKQKKHRAMGDEEWMSHLRTFAALGVWPSEAGNRPAPREKKCDTITRTLILFCITRSNIWTDSNTWANTVQAHFDVGIDNVPGQVDRLAEYFVGLRTETGQTLNNQQASTIIALWQNLLPYDQQPVAYAVRHQVRLTTGCFRCSKKKPDFTPGVESMTRCVLASTGSPAQWPNSCRLVDSIFVKLCDIHKSPKKQGNYALARWTLILRDYSKIRQLVLGNGTVMQSTTLQLFDVNQTTLIHWHNKRLKRQECSILLQGVNLPASIPVAPAPLPPVLVRPTAAPPHPGPQHQYHLQDRQWSRGSLQLWPNIPILHPRLQTQRQLFPQQAPPPTSAPLPVVPDPTPLIGPFVFLIPAAKLIAPAGPLVAPPPAQRAYNRTVDQNKCIKCHRNKETGHSHLTSGWKRCGGRGQKINRLVSFFVS
ncbi:hypothetical protein SKAU_G00415680 [Synaphobranchus kaupii]|uniref:Uncharacterized protein n=1 Tax=Synaphobranchus kaupii TaxID=118154 RepID=A0A9Q1E7B6_SYNKA|nr:hypothetical protein SKAU_G00415680 [Synaphobranchus kaupii]